MSVIGKTQCPKCAEIGKDRSHDNFVLYSDGGGHCFSCGYHVFADKLTSYTRQFSHSKADSVLGVRLPYDVVPFRGEENPRARRWIEQYGINQNVLLSAHLMWSDDWDRLIFPYFITGELVGWQGRYFGLKDKPKWFSQGQMEDFLYITGPNTGTIVLTEDIVSALKISSICAASPVFGSFISAKRIKMLRSVCDKIIIWLDPDKRKESVQFSRIAPIFGVSSHVVLSDKDPKEHTYEEIKDYVNQS